MNLYKILGLNGTASIEAVRKAYRNLMKTHHPDARDGIASQEYHAIQKAHHVLTNENLKAHYDETGEILEEVPVDHMRQVALGIISRVMVHVTAEQLDLSKTDLKNVLIERLQEGIRQLEKQLESLAVSKKRSLKIAKGWEVEEGDNILESIVNSQIKQIDNSRQAILGQIEAHELAIEIVNKHHFKYDEATGVVSYTTLWYTKVGSTA